MSYSHPNECGWFVNEVLLGLAPFVKKGTTITFDISGVGIYCTSKITFSHPQIYTEEEARQYEIEREKQRR